MCNPVLWVLACQISAWCSLTLPDPMMQDIACIRVFEGLAGKHKAQGWFAWGTQCSSCSFILLGWRKASHQSGAISAGMVFLPLTSWKRADSTCFMPNMVLGQWTWNGIESEKKDESWLRFDVSGDISNYGLEVTLRTTWPDQLRKCYSAGCSHRCLCWLLSPPVSCQGIGEAPPRVFQKAHACGSSRLQSPGPIPESVNQNAWDWGSGIWASKKNQQWLIFEFFRELVPYKSCFTREWGQKLVSFPETLCLHAPTFPVRWKRPFHPL